MCGIGFYWARERAIDRIALQKLFEGAAKRGGDGFGYSLIHPDMMEKGSSKIAVTDQEGDLNIRQRASEIENAMKVGDFFFLSFRATPETELQTNPEMLQPIISHEAGCILIHNGSVTETDNKRLRELEELGEAYSFKTQIDSEAIIAEYVNSGRDMKKCMENLSGAFAFVLLDLKLKKLYAVNSFLPLAHMYVKGFGYFLHSSNETLGEILQGLTGATEDGMNVWEYWYHHYLDGYTIIETDIDSGFQRKYNYRPKFLSVSIFSREQKAKEPTSIYISASGGIDSGVTTLALKHFLPEKKFNLCMVHFKYGQRGQVAEEWAVRKLSDAIGVQLKVLDISSLYSDFIKDCGMLMNKSNAVQSGGDKLKSTIAWVAGRNALFASLLLAKAESRMLYRADRRVLIAGGWAQLSEECLTLHKNNKVNTVERGNINPSEVKVGDWLWACDTETKRPVQTQVKEVRERVVTHVVRIKYRTSGPGFVECSRSHPFYVSGKGWVRAVDIKPGDEIWRKGFEIVEKNGMTGHVRGKPCWCGKFHNLPNSKNLSEGIKRAHQKDPSIRERIAKKCKSVMADPEMREKIRKAVKNIATPEWKKKVGEGVRKGIKKFTSDVEKWGGARNPEKVSIGVKRAIAEGRINPATNLPKPTKSEKELIGLFTSWWGENVIEYIGDGRIWITSNGRHMNPDFRVVGQNKVIEIWGSFWHTLEEMIFRKRDLRKVGWDCLLINWDELKNKEIVRTKIEEFAGISIHNGVKVLDVELIEKEEKVINYHCEPHNNFFVNSLLVHNTGGYPDNSFKFIEALKEIKKFGYITGQDIDFLNVLQNLTKTETWKLGSYLHFPFQYSVSCDNPTIDIDEVPCLCLECGSTKLSCIAADRADVHDPRRFNFRRDDMGKGVYYRPRFSDPAKPLDINSIIKRLNLPIVD